MVQLPVAGAASGRCCWVGGGAGGGGRLPGMVSIGTGILGENTVLSGEMSLENTVLSGEVSFENTVLSGEVSLH